MKINTCRLWVLAAVVAVLGLGTALDEGWSANSKKSNPVVQDAERIADTYLGYLKDAQYEMAYDMTANAKMDSEGRGLDLIAAEIFYEEYGPIRDYVLKEGRQVAPNSVSLFYEVEYATLKMDKELALVKRQNAWTVSAAKDDVASSPKAIQKMVNVMKKIAAVAQ